MGKAILGLALGVLRASFRIFSGDFKPKFSFSLDWLGRETHTDNGAGSYVSRPERRNASRVPVFRSPASTQHQGGIYWEERAGGP